MKTREEAIQLASLIQAEIDYDNKFNWSAPFRYDLASVHKGAMKMFEKLCDDQPETTVEPSVPADQIQSLIKTIREKLAKERGISPDRVLDKGIIILEQLIKNP